MSSKKVAHWFRAGTGAVLLALLAGGLGSLAPAAAAAPAVSSVVWPPPWAITAVTDGVVSGTGTPGATPAVSFPDGSMNYDVTVGADGRVFRLLDGWAGTTVGCFRCC